MWKITLAISLMASTTLLLELLLTRVFDVILTPHMAYVVITCAMFSFGLSGIYVTLRPLKTPNNVRKFLSMSGLMFAISALAILPVLNYLPFDYEKILKAPFIQAASFMGMYLVLVIPFFFSGLIFTTLFSAYAEKIQSLYFWDLTGAAVGCVILIPLIAPIGPGGLLFLVSALGLLASGLFSVNRMWLLVTGVVGGIMILIPFAHSPEYIEFNEHLQKRGVKEAKQMMHQVELTRWDPISKIDIIDRTTVNPLTQQVEPFSQYKHIAYDGGNQSSYIYPFDGNYKKLREDIYKYPERIQNHFWFQGVFASHYLKRDMNQSVLIIGSAGGQETKAAIMYGAAHVDAVEMVKAVVDAGKYQYALYNGNIFNHPNVDVYTAEGRSFLRANHSKYDIIQIFSNHTSSSIAAGTGAMAPSYLQTADAYREYFEHLTENGILHVNHHIYPRMVTTAALAWKWMGRKEFQKHVVVFEAVGIKDTLPTFLVKMKPWTEAEVNELNDFFSSFQNINSRDGNISFRMVENPVNPEESFLSPVFFSGDIPVHLVRNMDFFVTPTTDEKPYFNFLRKKIQKLEPDPEKFTSLSTAITLNSMLRKDVIPMDIIHLVVTGLVSLFFSGVFILLPLYFSKAGKSSWNKKYNSMFYFSCLGAGFIIIELVFIQIFMKLVGFPVYTYSAVIFALLFAAGFGSLCSRKLKITVEDRWTWPFIGIIIAGSIFCIAYPYIFDSFLDSSILIRIIVALLLIFPLGFFLGMPFPLGILAIEKQPSGAIAWAWGLNGLFTLIGGLASILLSIYMGFTATLLIALSLYVMAFLTFSRMREGAANVNIFN